MTGNLDKEKNEADGERGMIHSSSHRDLGRTAACWQRRRSFQAQIATMLGCLVCVSECLLRATPLCNGPLKSR